MDAAAFNEEISLTCPKKAITCKDHKFHSCNLKCSKHKTEAHACSQHFILPSGESSWSVTFPFNLGGVIESLCTPLCSKLTLNCSYTKHISSYAVIHSRRTLWRWVLRAVERIVCVICKGARFRITSPAKTGLLICCTFASCLSSGLHSMASPLLHLWHHRQPGAHPRKPKAFHRWHSSSQLLFS